MAKWGSSFAVGRQSEKGWILPTQANAGLEWATCRPFHGGRMGHHPLVAGVFAWFDLLCYGQNAEEDGACGKSQDQDGAAQPLPHSRGRAGGGVAAEAASLGVGQCREGQCGGQNKQNAKTLHWKKTRSAKRKIQKGPWCASTMPCSRRRSGAAPRAAVRRARRARRPAPSPQAASECRGCP